MNEKRARQCLDERLKSQAEQPSSNAEWQLVRNQRSIQELADLDPTPEEEVGEAAAEFITYAREMNSHEHAPRELRRTITQHSDPLTAPPWWALESKRRLDVARGGRVWLRVLAGLYQDDFGGYLDDGPLATAALESKAPYLPLGSVAEIAPLIRDMLWREEQRLRPLLAQPPFNWSSRDIDFRKSEISYPAASWEQDRRTETAFFLEVEIEPAEPAHQSLPALHRRSAWLANVLGITQAECLVWALTDVPFTIPWIATTIGRSGVGSGDWSSVTIHVSSMSATAQSVAKAYTLATRGASRGRGAVRRAPHPWPALLVAFVQSRSQETGRDKRWNEQFRAFATAYPGQPYKSMRTFRQTYYDQMKKRPAEDVPLPARVGEEATVNKDKRDRGDGAGISAVSATRLPAAGTDGLGHAGTSKEGDGGS